MSSYGRFLDDRAEFAPLSPLPEFAIIEDTAKIRSITP
jgi:hypothetical protein